MLDKSEKIRQIKLQKLFEQNGVCSVCGKILSTTGGQLAHKIGQNEWTIKKYGEDIIHHPDNMELVCGLTCNGKVDITRKPKLVEELANKIRKKLNK